MKPSQLLADPLNWTTGQSAINADGQTVSAISLEACKWCLLGALSKCYNGDALSEAIRKVRAKLREKGLTQSLWWFNDNNDHQTVVNLLIECGY